jgi:hypothetical protein
MSFAEFEKAIKAPALLQVAQHWNEARGSRTMPDWADIRPTSVAAQLSIIWSYRYDRACDALIGRLAGDQIEKVFGMTFRGTPMEVLYPQDQYPRMFERFRRVICEPALYVEEGKVFQVVDHYGFGERIAMPLSSDGVLGDGIIGATLYEAVRVNDASEHDDVCWFAL